LKKINPSGFIFSNDGGKTPVYHKTVTKALYRALNKIGISEEKRKTRNLSFHSWRHTFNSMLRSRVPDSKLKRLTGHLSQDMVEHYTHFDVKDFQDVKMIQEELFMIEYR
jgi:integrase